MCLAHEACARLVLAPIASAICLLVITPPAFWSTIHAAFDSSRFLATPTVRLPICRHLRRASGASPHTDTSVLGASAPVPAPPSATPVPDHGAPGRALPRPRTVVSTGPPPCRFRARAGGGGLGALTRSL